jgi:hypothetical protein
MRKLSVARKKSKLRSKTKFAQPTPQWVEAFKEEVGSYTETGDYKGALPVVEKAAKLYPQAFTVRFNYAKILGDWADELPPARKKKLKLESIKILKGLVRSLAGQSIPTRFSVSLNFYYQSEAWKEMYAYGKRFSRFDRQRALYAQGLAATLNAQEALSAKARAKAASWAKRAVAAWEKYDLKKDPYYFPTYNFAKALAIAGTMEADEKKAARHFAEAHKQLKSAAKLGKRPVTDWEFADVLTLLTQKL